MGGNALTPSATHLSALAWLICITLQLVFSLPGQAKAVPPHEQERLWRQLTLCTKDMSRIVSAKTHRTGSGTNLPEMSYPITPNSCRTVLNSLATVDFDNPEIRAALEPKLRASMVALPREAVGAMRLEVATALGHLLVLDQDWAEADIALQDGRLSFEFLYAKNWPHELSLANLVAPSDMLFDDSALVAAMLNDPKRAFRYINEGRGRLLRIHTNMRSGTIPDDKRHEIALDYILANPSFMPVSQSLAPKLGSDTLKAIRDLRSLINDKDATRIVDDGEITNIADFLPSQAAAIAFIISEKNSKGIVLYNNNGVAEFYIVDIPDFNFERSSSVIEYWKSKYSEFLQSNGDPSGSLMSLSARKKLRDGWLDAIDRVSNGLGKVLVAPIVATLKRIGVPPGARLYWMLPNGLDMMPLASAIDPDSGERLNSSYASILAANLEQIRFTKYQASKVSKPSLYALANPTGDLKFAGIEGKLVGSHFAPDAQAVISDGNPMLAITAPMGKTYWHYATHGYYRPDDIWQSAIVINSFTTISVRTILGSETDDAPRLVVLSACETGLSDSFFGSREFAGLAGAFIAKGAAGVISSLWPVDDRATALIMAKFYDLHIDAGQDPALALRNAQNWLRSATENDIVRYIDQALSGHRVSEADASTIKQSVQERATEVAKFDLSGNVYDDPSQRPLFERPYYWASFYYVGY